MKKNLKKILTIGSFVALIVFLISGYILTKGKETEFNILEQKTADYKKTTLIRVLRSVISLPDDNNITVGMKDGVGSYKIPSIKREGVLKFENNLLTTSLVKGTFKIEDPRLDAIIPMAVSSDSLDGSKYIILFHDRGDFAIEKSYARIGNLNTEIKSIEIIDKDKERLIVPFTHPIKHRAVNILSIFTRGYAFVIQGFAQPVIIKEKAIHR